MRGIRPPWSDETERCRSGGDKILNGKDLQSSDGRLQILLQFGDIRGPASLISMKIRQNPYSTVSINSLSRRVVFILHHRDQPLLKTAASKGTIDTSLTVTYQSCKLTSTHAKFQLSTRKVDHLLHSLLQCREPCRKLSRNFCQHWTTLAPTHL